MALTCAVKNCSNSAYWLNKWKKQLCDTCGCLHKDKYCKCDPPFRLYTFPTLKKNPERRERWKQLIGRKNGNKLWSPSKDFRVCNEHFVEGQPTLQNPLPTLKLGYDGYENRVRRIQFFTPEINNPYPIIIEEVAKNPPKQETEDPPMEHLSYAKQDLPWFVWMLCLILGLVQTIICNQRKMSSLTKQVVELKLQVKKLKSNKYVEHLLKTDEDVNFHTGLKTVSMFNKLHGFIEPLVNRRWTGVSSLAKNVRQFSKEPCRFGPDRKITSKCEFLLMLMKLRLGLLNKDLSKRFNISETLCSRIFFAWLRASSSVLRSLIFTPDEEMSIATKPERFRVLSDLHSIIDCTELFIETPKDLYLQSATWSDYKHHNTMKLLICCSPNSLITYVSPAYTGRISDKALTRDCGFLEMVPPYSMIMADKGFNISEECAANNISLYVTPGKRGQSQMPSASEGKTKKIANHRILIEQVIGRIKTFRILANEIPLSLISHVDEMTSLWCSVQLETAYIQDLNRVIS